MPLSQILNLLKEYIAFGIVVLLLITIILSCIYRKKSKVKKIEINKKKIVVLYIFIFYIIIVIGAVFLSRGNDYIGNMNIELFNSHKEAYYSGEMSNWRNIILNILLFVPMGFLLPLLCKKLNKLYRTISIGLVITVLIEIIQAVAHLGIFEIDDIFNNVLGTFIGFLIINTILIICNKEEKHKVFKTIRNLSPIIIIILIFVIIFFVYNTQELGYLSVVAISKIKMENISIENNIENLSNESKNASIYKAKTYTIDETRKIAEEILSGFDGYIKDSIEYENSIIYYSNVGSIRIYYVGGTYDLTIANIKDTDELNNIQELTEFEVLNYLNLIRHRIRM